MTPEIDSLDLHKLYDILHKWEAGACSQDDRDFVLNTRGREVMEALPTLLRGYTKYLADRDRLTHLVARFMPIDLEDRWAVERAANVRIVFALEELAIPGWCLKFNVWKDGRVYEESPDAVSSVYEALLEKMERIAPDAKKAMEAYSREDGLRRKIEDLQEEVVRRGERIEELEMGIRVREGERDALREALEEKEEEIERLGAELAEGKP